MGSLPNERQDGHTKDLKKKMRGMINILRNPITLPGDGIIRDQAIFNMFLRRKRNVVLGVSKAAGETRQAAAVFITALCRLRVNFFAREGKWESAHMLLENYDSWASDIETVGKFSHSFDILNVTEEGITEMRRVLNVISGLQTIQDIREIVPQITIEPGHPRKVVRHEYTGLRWAAIWGPLSSEWFQQDELLEAVYAGSNIPDFLPPPEKFESSSRNGGTDDVTS